LISYRNNEAKVILFDEKNSEKFAVGADTLLSDDVFL